MRNIGKLFIATVIMANFAIQANAQSSTKTDQADQKQTASKSTAGNFVDKDNNGVCDNLGSRSGNGQSVNFVDKNGDGICDNRANVGNKAGKKCRNVQGNQNRNGQCRGPRNCGRR